MSSEMVNVRQDLGKMKCCCLSSEEKTDKCQEGGNWEGCRESRGCVGTAVITASVIDDDFRYLLTSQRPWERLSGRCEECTVLKALRSSLFFAPEQQ